MNFDEIFDESLRDNGKHDYEPNNIKGIQNTSLIDRVKNILKKSDGGDKTTEVLHAEQLELEQALITKKHNTNTYSVEREFVNSKSYHDKFERLPVNKDVQESLYKEAGRLLEFVDGQEEERLIAINARTGEFIVDNFEREGSIKGTGFNKKEMREINECRDNIVLIHNHSLNGRPSAQDILTYLDEERVKLSLIACHDGTLYGIYEVKPEFKKIYKRVLREKELKTSDNKEAERLAMTELYKFNDTLGKRHKIFKIEKL